MGDHPHRFLYSDFASVAPLPLIAAWLDFAHNKQEGMLWIEALRPKQESWLYHRSPEGEPRDLRRFDTIPARDTRMAFERERVIPALNKLMARKAVLDGYEAQYALLEQYQMTPGELEHELTLLAPPQGDEEGMLVLLADQAVG